MKRITAVILTAICILTSGCADSGDVNKRNPAYDSTGNYTYMVVTNDGGVGTVLCRFDIDSGIVTPMCTDPLCRHDDPKECLFANLSRCFARGDKIVIPTYNSYDPLRKSYSWQVIGYDIPSDSFKVWYKYNEDYSELPIDDTVIGDYYYCRYTGVFKNGDGDEAYDTTVTYRINMSDGKYENLDIEDLPCAEYGGRYFYNEDRILFSTDLNGNDRQEYKTSFLVGDAYFDWIGDGIIIGAGFGQDRTKLFRININTGEITETDFGMYIFDLCVGDDYIYMLCADPDKSVIGYDSKQGKDIYNETGGKLWRMKPDLSETELYKDFGNDYSFWTSMDYVDRRIILDYGAIVTDQMWKVDTWNEKGGGKVVIDTVTDEYTVFERTWNLPSAISVN